MNNKVFRIIARYGLSLIFVIFLMLGSFMTGYKSGCNEYENYYDKTEILLGSISSWYGHKAFQDSIINTDTYYEYELAKEQISTK